MRSTLSALFVSRGLLTCCVVALVSLTLGASSPADAQRRRRRPAASSPDTAQTDRARSLFAEGVSLVAESRFAEAEARFREALGIRDAPAIRYNLASVLFEQGQYPEAQVENERALAAEGVPEPVQTAALELRRHLSERAGYVRFELEGPTRGASVSIDGYTLAEPSLEVPVSPSPHGVVVSLDGAELARRDIEVPAGAHRTIVFGEPPVLVVPEPIVAGRSIDQEDWFWPVVAGGGVVLVAIVGVSIGVAATSGTEGPVEGNFTPGVIRWP